MLIKLSRPLILTFTHTLPIIPIMSPTVIFKSGERLVEVNISTQDVENLYQALEDHAVNRLIDPKTRKPYDEINLLQNINLRKGIKKILEP